jgi:hypothetical protein
MADDAQTDSDYMKLYQSTLRLLNNSKVLFDQLASTSPNADDREKFRSQALQAARDIDMLNTKLRIFTDGIVTIRPPTPEEVQKAEGLSQALATLAAHHARADDMIKLVSDAVDTFNAVAQA